MRNGLRVLAAVVLAAGVAACDAGDEDVELFEGQEAATPSLDGDAAAPAPIITADFQPGEAATGTVSGIVRIYPEEDATNPVQGTNENPDATVTRSGQQGFQVELTMEGVEQGEHAWHIHSGPCGEQAPIVVPFTPAADMEGIASALTAGADGNVEGEATVPADMLTLERLQSGEYSLHVHAGAGLEHGPTIACADLGGGPAAM